MLQFITNIEDVDSTCFFVGVVDYDLIDQIDSKWEASKPGELIEPESNEIPVRNLQEYIDVLNIKKRLIWPQTWIRVSARNLRN